MKKLALLVPVLLLSLTGCGTTQTGTINCTLSTNDVINGYKLESSYKINYTGDYVDNVETLEEVTSESEVLLDTFETTLNDTYSATNQAYGGYTYTVTNESGKVTSKVTIDYSEMNIDKYVKDQPVLKSYVEDGKMLVDGVKAIYESMGATCE